MCSSSSRPLEVILCFVLCTPGEGTTKEKKKEKIRKKNQNLNWMHNEENFDFSLHFSHTHTHSFHYHQHWKFISTRACNSHPAATTIENFLLSLNFLLFPFLLKMIFLIFVLNEFSSSDKLTFRFLLLLVFVWWWN